MGGLNNQQKKAWAERLYINDGKTAKAIAMEVQVAESTVLRWKKGREGEQDWDARRTLLLSAPHRIREIVLSEMERLSKGEEKTIDADAIVKLSKVYETLTGKISAQFCISVLMELDNWMAGQNPEMAVNMLEYHKQFISYKISLENE